MTSLPPSALTASGVQRRQGLARLRDKPLQPGEIVRRLERRRVEHALLHALDGAAGVLGDRDDLETERQHVRRQPRLDDGFGIDALLAEMRKAACRENHRPRRGSADSSPRWRRRVKEPCGFPLCNACFQLARSLSGNRAACNRRKLSRAFRRGLPAIRRSSRASSSGVNVSKQPSVRTSRGAGCKSTAPIRHPPAPAAATATAAAYAD